MEERKRMLKERKKRKRRQRLLERKNRVDARLVAELKEETKRMEQQRQMYAYLSRKYYDRWCSLLKTKENCKIRKSICIPEQRKVRIDRPVFTMHLSMSSPGGGGLATHGNLTVAYIPRVGILTGHHAFDLSILYCFC